MRLSKDSCKKSLSQDSLTLEELSSRLTGRVKGFATEEAAREYSRASIIGRQARAPLALCLLHRPRRRPHHGGASEFSAAGASERVAARRQIRRRPVRPRHSSSRHSLV